MYIKKSLFILLIFLSYPVYSQSTTSDYCEQFKLALDYIKSDKDIKVGSLRVDSLLRSGWNYSLFATEYIVTKLELTKEDVLKNKSKETNDLWQKIERNSSYNSSKAIICKKINTKRKKVNTIFSKLDDDTLLVNVTSHRPGKEGASGRTYLFFFKKYKIIKVFEAYWIE